MDSKNSNASEFKSNVTLDQVIDYFNLNATSVNQSGVTQSDFDLNEAYRTFEKERQLMPYKSVAYILGTLIILSNLTVVISSGLILRKGQQPKSTYLLLGNISLADTIIGFSIIYLVTVGNSVSSNNLCIFQIGMLVCPAMVSIFSVGLIAIDRYMYILHGLYYNRWFNTTRVRIGIALIWMIGITLGFMPATGWTNTELIIARCYYVTLFPSALLLLNSLLSLVPIIVVSILYCIILIKALKTINKINSGTNNVRAKANATDRSKLRNCRANLHGKSNKSHTISQTSNKLARSLSCNIDGGNHSRSIISSKFHSNVDLTNANNFNRSDDGQINRAPNSVSSVFTIESNISNLNSTNLNNTGDGKNDDFDHKKRQKSNVARKTKEPNKWRAITIVMLTSGSFIFTLIPYFVIVILNAFCEEKLTNSRCLYYRKLLRWLGAPLSFLNSILNPLIYAWWHKGFQKSVRMFYHKYVQKHICRTR